MRSFQQIVVFLFTLLVCAFAEEQQYDSTVYITSTVYRVNTVTMSGSHTGVLANQTSTIPAMYPTGSHSGNGSVIPTSTSTLPSPSAFTGAASSLNVGSYVVALAAGVGYLVL